MVQKRYRKAKAIKIKTPVKMTIFSHTPEGR
jgi:hypothetical protein